MEPKSEPRLLVSDKEAIERAARALRRGSAFVVLVCPGDLTEQTRDYLSAEAGALRETVPVASGEAMLDVLIAVSAASESDPIFSVSVADGSRDAFVALNIHREKVLRGGRLVLWLDSSEGLESLRQIAPDAWAFRTAVVVVHGDGGMILPRRTKDEPEDLVEWRKRLKRAKSPLDKARAGQNLAEILRRVGALAKASQMARESLAIIPAGGEEERATRMRLLASLSSTLLETGARAEARRVTLQALADADSLPFAKGASWRVYLLAGLPGPFAVDRESALEAVSLARRFGVEPNHMTQALRSRAVVLNNLGDFRGAREALDECEPLFVRMPSYQSLPGRVDRLMIGVRSGRFSEVESTLRETAELANLAGMDVSHVDRFSIELLIFRGEVSSAERALQRIELTEPGAEVVQWGRRDLLLLTGKTAAAFRAFRDAITELEQLGQDGSHLDSCGHLVEVIETAHQAERLSIEDKTDSTAILDMAQTASRRMTGTDAPPWYEVEFLTLRARVRALNPSCHSETDSLFRAALEQAHGKCPDLVPRCANLLAAHLVASKQPEEALSLLRDIESETSSKGMLRELSNIRATQARALAALGRPETEIDERMQVLRAAVESMDSPRGAAEVLLDLASDLPPATRHPDVLSLAEEAQLLFFEMPMPAQEARAMERAGDALLARGRPAEARNRYAAAKARLERFGLLLRVPLLERKLASIDKQAPSS